MEIPQTKEQMECPIFTLGDIEKIFPADLKPNTVQVWAKRGIFAPAVQSQGQGYPTRFNYLNLIEIAIVRLLVARGVNEHAYLRALLNSGRPNGLVEHMRALAFSNFLMLPGGMRVQVHEGEEIDREKPKPLWYYRPAEDLKQLSEIFGIPDWFLINTNMLKWYLDGKLADLA
jgi:hypothetical protein